MVRTAARPARFRPETQPPPPAAARVPARRTTHWRDTALLVALGLVGYGSATLQGQTTLALAALVGGPLLGLLVGFLGERRRQRMLTQDRTLEALVAEPILRFARLDRRSVRMLRWTGWRSADGARGDRQRRWWCGAWWAGGGCHLAATSGPVGGHLLLDGLPRLGLSCGSRRGSG